MKKINVYETVRKRIKTYKNEPFLLIFGHTLYGFTFLYSLIHFHTKLKKKKIHRKINK